MQTPFDNLPFNTSAVYLLGTVPNSGCKIYVPSDLVQPEDQKAKQQELQFWLDQNFPYEDQLA